MYNNSVLLWLLRFTLIVRNIMVLTQSQKTDIRSEITEYLNTNTHLNVLADKLAEAVMNKIDKKFEELQLKCQHLEATVTQLQLKNDNLVEKLDDLEQYSRRACLRVFGVNEKPNEDTEQSLSKIFMEKVGLEIKPEFIDRCHRVGKLNSDMLESSKPRAIIIKFTSYKYRKLLYDNKSKLKGTGMFIHEDLTKRRMDLLRLSIQKFGRTQVWTLDGKIFACKNGKKFTVLSKQDLDNSA